MNRKPDRRLKTGKNNKISMKKGQISTDLLISLAVVLIVISSLGAVTLNLKDSQEKIFLQNQLKERAISIASVINSSQTMDDSEYAIKMSIQEVKYKEMLFNPNITFEEGRVIVSENKSGESIQAEENFYKKDDVKLTLEENILVITNE